MEWIDSSKVKPHCLYHALVALEGGEITVAYCDYHNGGSDHPDEKDSYYGWFFGYNEKLIENREVTHWMPLPDHPGSC